MRLRAFSSIGGLRLIGSTAGAKDCLDLKVHRDDLSALATAMIQEIGFDASPVLIRKCQELCEAVEKDLQAANPERAKLIEFIAACEDNAGESKRSDETDEEYIERLKKDYGYENKTE